jgi:hypothetical protein
MIEFFGLSEVGGHRENEDAWDAVVHPRDPGCRVCVVADGQGGQPGGRAAALRALWTCLDLAGKLPAEELLFPWAWPALLHQVDKAVEAAPEAGFTTLVAMAVSLDRLAGASSGDSGAALVQDGAGRILTEGQRKNPPVGSGEAVFVPFAAGLRAPWTVLAVTDGVWKYAGWEAVLTEARRLPGARLIPELRRRAALPGGGLQDDFTAVALYGEP